MRTARSLAWPALALGLILAAAGLAAGQTDDPGPASLADPAEDLGQGLTQLSEAEDLDQARRIHADQVQPPAAELSAYLVDLAGDDGQLTTTYLDRIATALDEGELADARSLAGAAANLLDDEIQPVAEAWDANRTMVVVGNPSTEDGRVRIPVVLVNPPPDGTGAYDVSLTTPQATPRQAHVELGQGETRIEEANGTVRWASFDASSTARLSGPNTERVVLGEAIVTTDARPGTELGLELSAHEVLGPDGDPVPAVGVDGHREVPEPDSTIDRAWWTLGGVGVAAVGLGWWVHRWEV